MKLNNIQIFNNKEFGNIRAFQNNGQSWFCLTDVCKILGLDQPSRVKERLNLDGVTSSKVIDSLGREQQANFINESNLYKAIFQSRKVEAEKFTEWVTSDVLPSIRKHGMYATEELLDNPDLLIKVATELKEEREKRKLLEEEKKVNAPKVLFAEALEVSDNTILIGELAKLLRQNGINIGQNRLFERLRSEGYLIKKKGESYNLPTQRAMDQELFQIKTRTINNPDGSIRTTRTTKITGKGQVYFINKFKEEI